MSDAAQRAFTLTPLPTNSQNIPPSGVIDTGVTVIDKSNVDAFKAELAEMRKSVQ